MTPPERADAPYVEPSYASDRGICEHCRKSPLPVKTCGYEWRTRKGRRYRCDAIICAGCTHVQTGPSSHQHASIGRAPAPPAPPTEQSTR